MRHEATNIAWINEKLAVCFSQRGDHTHARKNVKHTGFYKKGQHPFRFCPLVHDTLKIRYNPSAIPPMAASPGLSNIVPSQKPQAYHAFNDITPVPKILVTSEEINVISWKTSMVSARRPLSLFTGSMPMNTLTPMVAVTPTASGKGARSSDSDGKRGGRRTHR